MKSTTLIIPGLHDSGPEHWQTWMLTQIDGAQRVDQHDWSQAVIETWSQRVGEAIDRAVGQVWLIAHSFGCLAAVTATVGRADRVAGALLVAPANPERFAAHGLIASRESSIATDTNKETITAHIPHRPLGIPAVVVASANDPWMRLTAASVWADRWGAQFECIGRAGHINADSGFGPWPQGLSLFERFRRAHGGHPLGSIETLHARRFVAGNVANEGAFEELARHGDRGLDQQWFG